MAGIGIRALRIAWAWDIRAIQRGSPEGALAIRQPDPQEIIADPRYAQEDCRIKAKKRGTICVESSWPLRRDIWSPAPVMFLGAEWLVRILGGIYII
jgi:hypothetical protein